MLPHGPKRRAFGGALAEYQLMTTSDHSRIMATLSMADDDATARRLTDALEALINAARVGSRRTNDSKRSTPWRAWPDTTASAGTCPPYRPP